MYPYNLLAQSQLHLRHPDIVLHEVTGSSNQPDVAGLMQFLFFFTSGHCL
jgi:hypothetical protein